MQAGKTVSGARNRFRGEVLCARDARRSHGGPWQVLAALQQQASGTAQVDQNLAGLQMSRVLHQRNRRNHPPLDKAQPRLMVQGMEPQTGDTEREPECEQEHHASPAVGVS